jgi:peptidoglycan hydrolase-like protein with peptidoglycan-binding domain
MSVQKELAQLGYYHGPIDGIAGSQTERAVRDLRKKLDRAF